ncbi:MAG: aminotransferase class V-fold PLP-dependent enzyme [Candidatus Dormibacteraeota bacterium]|nr:aminotransferase class V-fold PLP-dependent enzyme [Candidatus Dormibacteraeota bacterium]
MTDPSPVGEESAPFAEELAEAAALDRADPLAWAREQFHTGAQDPPYLDGNSLGRLPRRSLIRLLQVVEEEWGHGLVRSWAGWMGMPTRVGDRLGEVLLGAGPGQVVVADSTSVNLYKLAAAALDALPERSVVVTDRANFPTDRYLLAGLTAGRRLKLRSVDFDEVMGPTPGAVGSAVGRDTALVLLSHVDYRSGALADMAGISAVVRDAGALTLWDLSHSVGAVPITLDESRADLAAGCTYKYLNAGPGSPAFLYVSGHLQRRLQQPIWGWMGKRDPFAMEEPYSPQEGIGSFLSGTPQILGLALVEEGVELLAELGIERVRAKSLALTDHLVGLVDGRLEPLGFRLATPRQGERRGSQVTLRHPRARELCERLDRSGEVVLDFRPPDRVRLGCAAPTTSFTDLVRAVGSLARSAAELVSEYAG